jgi:hypothetical protein
MKEIASSSNTKYQIKPKQKDSFDAQAFLDSAGVAKRVVEYRKSQKIYSQGVAAKSIVQLQEGGAAVPYPRTAIRRDCQGITPSAQELLSQLLMNAL